jgi:hypothetical protein
VVNLDLLDVGVDFITVGINETNDYEVILAGRLQCLFHQDSVVIGTIDQNFDLGIGMNSLNVIEDSFNAGPEHNEQGGSDKEVHQQYRKCIEGVDIIDIHCHEMNHYRVGKTDHENGREDPEHVVRVGITDQSGMDTHSIEHRTSRNCVKAGVNKEVSAEYLREFKLLDNEIGQ